MNFINKMERKIGKWAVPNLIVYLIGGYAIGYVLQIVAPSILNYMTLEPYYIIHEFQIWRLLSWVMIPPSTGLLWAVIMMFLYYQLGQTLERTWGTFRFNLYMWGGVIFTIIGAFLLYGFFALQGKILLMGTAVSTYYINLGIFLAFATCFPDMQVMLYFIIPVKMKYMAILYGIMVIYDFLNKNSAARVVIFMSLLNYLIFFLTTRNYKRINPAQAKRRRAYKKATSASYVQRSRDTGITKHKCAICGRTEKDGMELEFRFCSRCDGNYEYCQEHLFTHEHVKRS